MKTRMVEAKVQEVPVPAKDGSPVEKASPAPRPILAFTQYFGAPHAGVLVVILTAVLYLASWCVANSPAKVSPGYKRTYHGWGCPPGRTLPWYARHTLKADALTALGIVQCEVEDWISPPSPQQPLFLNATTNSGNIPENLTLGEAPSTSQMGYVQSYFHTNYALRSSWLPCL